MAGHVAILIGISVIVALGGALLIASAIQSAIGGSPFVPLSSRVAIKMMEALALQAGDTLYELGCGDGRNLVLACCNHPGIHAVGVEIAWGPMLRARLNRWWHRLSGQIDLIQGHIRDIDLSPADAVFLYLAPELLQSIHSKLRTELRPGTRIASARYALPGWQAREVIRERYPIFLYTV